MPISAQFFINDYVMKAASSGRTSVRFWIVSPFLCFSRLFRTILSMGSLLFYSVWVELDKRKQRWVDFVGWLVGFNKCPLLCCLFRSPGGGTGHCVGLQCPGHALPHPPPGSRLPDELGYRQR